MHTLNITAKGGAVSVGSTLRSPSAVGGSNSTWSASYPPGFIQILQLKWLWRHMGGNIHILVVVLFNLTNAVTLSSTGPQAPDSAAPAFVSSFAKIISVWCSVTWLLLGAMSSAGGPSVITWWRVWQLEIWKCSSSLGGFLYDFKFSCRLEQFFFVRDTPPVFVPFIGLCSDSCLKPVKWVFLLNPKICPVCCFSDVNKHLTAKEFLCN